MLDRENNPDFVYMQEFIQDLEDSPNLLAFSHALDSIKFVEN